MKTTAVASREPGACKKLAKWSFVGIATFLNCIDICYST